MIKLLIGVSGVGKSHYALQIWDSNSVIISRDKIRELLWGHTESNIHSYYNRSDFGSREKDVTVYQNELIEYSLSKGKTVILDNTHLKLRYINQIKKKFYYTDIKFIDVAKEQGIAPLQLRPICIERDNQRTRQVGQVVITQQIRDYQQLLKDFDFKPYKANVEPIVQNKSLPKAICVDLDGTLACMEDRSPYDWSNVHKDTINEYVANIVRAFEYYQDYKIIICTGRDGSCENATKGWLYINGFSYDEFYIRPAGNTEPDYIIKERMWRDIASRYYIESLWDDRAQVIEHGVRLGLNIINVKGIKQDF